MAKKSKKQRAKKRSTSTAPARAVAAAVAIAPAVRHESGTQLRQVRVPVMIDDDVDVEVCVTSERDVEEALAAVAEELRASERVAVAVDIHLASDSQFFSGLSGDISEGGLFLSTYRPLPIGSAVDLEFSLPGSAAPVHARGEVRWLREHSTDQPRGVGIAFDELAEEDRDLIHRFCTVRPPLYYDVG